MQLLMFNPTSPVQHHDYNITCRRSQAELNEQDEYEVTGAEQQEHGTLHKVDNYIFQLPSNPTYGNMYIKYT